MTLGPEVLASGTILLLAVGAALVTQRLRVPVLIAFLAIGMLLGSEGPGGVYFADAKLARTVGIVGLIAILYEGGLTTRWQEIRPVLVPASLLSTMGVAITAAVVAVVARPLFHLSWAHAFLLGAVVGPTDAAAVFATLRFTRVRRRLGALLRAESGLNDPMAVALTVGFIAWIVNHQHGPSHLVLLLVRELGVGLVVGLVIGAIAARALARMPAELAPFAPVASVGVAALGYGTAAVAHGSGFLAVYLVGLFVGNAPLPLRRSIVPFHEGIAFLVQVVLFVVLGLLAFPSRLPSIAVPALLCTLVLLFAARPLAVSASLAPLGYRLREQAFLAWAGLRGAVPIVLATFGLSAGVGGADTIFDAVFFIVLVSTLAQGSTLEPLARVLGLAADAAPSAAPPFELGALRSLGGEVIEHEVAQGDAVVGSRVRELGLPRAAIVMLVVRDGDGFPPRGGTTIEPDDRLFILARADSRAAVERLIDSWQRAPQSAPDQAS